MLNRTIHALPLMHIESVRYRNHTMLFSERINVICGNNGVGKSLLLNELYGIVNGTGNENVSVSNITFNGEREDGIKTYYIRQNDRINKKEDIDEKMKECLGYYLIKKTLADALSNLDISNDDLIFRLKKADRKIKSSLDRFLKYKQLLHNKEKIEKCIKKRESAIICEKIVEIQDKINQEESVNDCFENEAMIMKKEKLEKEVLELKKEIEKTDETSTLERKKILWREESKLKEKIKKHRNERRVVDLIEVDERVLDPVVAVLGNKLKYKVVNHEDEALDEIKKLRFRQTYIVMDKIDVVETEDEGNETMIPLARVVKTKKEHNKLNMYLFKDVYLVKDLRQHETSKKMLVTLKGEVLHRSGAISGGHDNNKEYHRLFMEKNEYRKNIERLGEIEKELKDITDTNTSAKRRELLQKIIDEKNDEIKKIKINNNYINFNLERLKLLLNRLISQKEALGYTNDDHEVYCEYDDIDVYKELGHVNKELKEVMIDKRIDYEEMNKKIEALLARNAEMTENKKKIEELANTLLNRNDNDFESSSKAVYERIIYYYKLIGQHNENEVEGSAHDIMNNEDHDIISKISSMSGGQLQMLTLSLMLSLNEIHNFDVVFLDEIDSNLDDSKIGNLSSILQRLKAQVFLVTHRRNGLTGEKYFWIDQAFVEEISRNEAEARIAQ